MTTVDIKEIAGEVYPSALAEFFYRRKGGNSALSTPDSSGQKEEEKKKKKNNALLKLAINFLGRKER